MADVIRVELLELQIIPLNPIFMLAGISIVGFFIPLEPLATV